MSIHDTCRCVGSFCTCNGVSVLKDGGRFRIPVMMRDASISGEKHMVVDAMMSDSDRAYLEMKRRDANAWRGGEPPAITPERIIDGGPEYAQGIREGAYEAMKERDRDAWRKV